MPKEILEYLQSQRICVLAVEMPDGSPHAATLHFAYSPERDHFCFMTDKESRKYKSLLASGKTRASLVVGFDETNKKTFQADGELIAPVSDIDKKQFKEAYAGKFPKKEQACDDEDSGTLIFTPTWRRFTDWTFPEGEGVWTSTGKINGDS